MSDYARSNDWYALFVATGDEENVKQRVKYRFQDKIDVIVPKRQLRERKNGVWSETIKTMFPGYVLINGEVEIEDYYSMKTIPGIIRLLRSGHSLLKIDPNEIDMIGRLTYDDETIGFSDVLIENGHITVVDGPLVSLEGFIVSINRRKGRARVQLNFLGEQRTVELGVSILQPA